MKKKFTIVAILLFSILFAQAPAGFNYQAIVKNAEGQLILNQNVNFRFSIKQGSSTSTPLFIETHQVSTDNKSQVNLIIGQGTASIGSLAQIDWSLTPLYLGVELNIGNGYITVSTNDLISVPYALYATKAGSTVIPNLADVLASGNDATAKKITNLATPIDPKDGVNIDYLTSLKTKLDNQEIKIKATSDTLIKKGLIVPQIEWEKELTSPSTFNNRVDLIQTKDEGFAILSLGSNSNYTTSDKIIISRVTKTGTLLWQKSFDRQALSMIPQRIIETSDLGFIICGSGKLVKLNSSGNIVWQNNSLTQRRNFLNNLYQQNGTIIYCNGYSIFKLDNYGNLIWESNLVDNTSSINHIKPTSDGGTIVVGKTFVSIEKDFDAIMIKVDVNGNILWSKTFGDIKPDDAQRIIQTKDGGFVFSGYTSNDSAASFEIAVSWILKTDSLGEIKWQKNLENFNFVNYNILKNIEETDDLSLIYVVSTDGHSFIKLSPEGDFQWKKNIKITKWYTNYEMFSYLALTNDKGLMVTELVEEENLVNGYSQPISTKLKLVKLSYRL